MQKKYFFGLIFFILALYFSFGLNTKAYADIGSTTPIRLFYFKDTLDARNSLLAHPNSIDILAPQEYKFDVNGVLEGTIDPDILKFAKMYGIKVMPVVTNGSFDQASLGSILNNSGTEDAAINELVTVAKQEGYWGWQIDFEQMDVSYKDKYSEFIGKLSDAFKQNNLKLSVAVVAKTSENPADYPKNLWNNLIGVYDYAALASSTDFISLMSYDDPLSRGPVSPYNWVDQVTQYALKYIPPQKLSLGLGLYYWKWNSTTGKLVEIGGFSGLQNALQKSGIVLGYSPVDHAPFLNYIAFNNFYTIWYENGKSVQDKLDLISKYGLQGFSVWALGLETPDVYNVISATK